MELTPLVAKGFIQNRSLTATTSQQFTFLTLEGIVKIFLWQQSNEWMDDPRQFVIHHHFIFVIIVIVIVLLSGQSGFFIPPPPVQRRQCAETITNILQF